MASELIHPSDIDYSENPTLLYLELKRLTDFTIREFVSGWNLAFIWPPQKEDQTNASKRMDED